MIPMRMERLDSLGVAGRARRDEQPVRRTRARAGEPYRRRELPARAGPRG